MKAIFGFLLAVAPCVAIGASSSRQFENDSRCTTNADTLADCARDAREKADQELSTLLSEVEHRIGDVVLADFRAMNQSWLALRDASCRFETSGFSGRSGDYAREMCWLTYNQERIALMRKYLRCTTTTAPCGNGYRLSQLLQPPE